MARSKWPHVKVKLLLVEEWAKSGLTEFQIAANLGISRSTLSAFKREHPELVEALSKGRAIAVAQIENSLFKRALGFHYEVTKVSVKMIGGVEVRYTEKSVKYMPPDVGACFILLKNKDRPNWSDRPAEMDLEKEIFEFNKLVEKIKLYGNDSQ